MVAAEVGALVVLLRLDVPSVDWSGPAAWLERVPPEDAVIALVRLAALALAGYLLVTTALYAVATLTRVPALIRGVKFLTLPSVRRLIDGTMAAALVATPASFVFAATPASAQAAPTAAHAYVPVVASDTGVGYTPTPAGESPSSPNDSDVYVVRSGDNLWTIASQRLAALREVPAENISNADVADFWRALVEPNTPSLASGNPDVIYAGETIRLPVG